MSAPTITSSNPSIQAAIDRIHEFGPYGYQPSLPGSIVFCLVWAICAGTLAYQSIRGRRWWLLATLGFGSVLECAGNGIRIYGHFSPDVVNAYISQQVILVLTPAFFAAAHFTIVVKVCQMSKVNFIHPLKPSWLIPFFVVLDVASLAIQGAGSGKAAVAEISNESVSTVNGNGEIVTAGLGLQLAGYVAFNVVFLLFVRRASKFQGHHLEHPQQGQGFAWDSSTKRFLVATWISALLVLGRSCFRTAEMAKGWIGTVATTEWYYLVFDATFVAIAVILLTIMSPAKYLARSQDAVEGKSDVEKLPVTSSNTDAESHDSSFKVAGPILGHDNGRSPA